jgi:hypothetical protein
MNNISLFRMSFRGRYLTPLLALMMIAALNLAFFDSAQAATRADIRRLVVEEAMNSHVPPSLAMAVAKVESDFQPKALSSAGARGVMQIMPATAMGEYGVGAEELWDARLNVQLGIDFLEHLIGRYDGRWDLALSHYNGGSVTRTRSGMEPLTATRKYVEAVLKWQKRYAEQATVWALAEAPDEGWQPARTDLDDHASRLSPGVDLEPSAWNPPHTDNTGTVVLRSRRPQSDGSLDDFDNSFKMRLLQTQGTLDDLTPVVIWHEG